MDSKGGPPVTGDGDAAREWDGSLADSYNWADRTPQECLAAARAIERDSHAAGLTRGRALGAREEREVFIEALTCDDSESKFTEGCGHSLCRDVLDIARRAGRGG